MLDSQGVRQGAGKDLHTSSERRNVIIGWVFITLLVVAGFFIARHHGIDSLDALREFLGKLSEDLREKFRREPMPYLIAGTLAAIFLGIVIKLIVDSVSLLKFGVTTLRMDPNPGSIGGQLGGALQLGYALQPGDTVKVTAVCWRHYVRRSGGKSQSSQERYWSDEVAPEVSQQFGQLVLRFTFDVPDTLPPSGKRNDDRFRWQVLLRIDRKGRDIVRSFTVPVEAGEPRSAARPMRMDQVTQESRDFPGVEIVDSPGSLAIRGLPGRNRGMNLFISSFGFVFGGIGVFLGYDVALDNWSAVFESSRDGIGKVFSVIFAVMSSFMALVFAGMGLLLLGIGVVSARNRRELSIANGRLLTRNRGKEEALSLDDVEAIEVSESGSMGANTVHDVHALASNGRRVEVLQGIPGKMAAKRIVELLQEHAGKPVEVIGKAEKRARKMKAKGALLRKLDNR